MPPDHQADHNADTDGSGGVYNYQDYEFSFHYLRFSCNGRAKAFKASRMVGLMCAL